MHQFCLECGIAHSMLYRFFKGERSLRLDTFERLCDFLGLVLRKKNISIDENNIVIEPVNKPSKPDETQEVPVATEQPESIPLPSWTSNPGNDSPTSPPSPSPNS